MTATMTCVLVVRLPPGGVDRFERYEREVRPLIEEHGGALERRLRSADRLTEVHLVSFPSEEALDAYREDPRRTRHAPLLTSSGAATELLELRDSGRTPAPRPARKRLREAAEELHRLHHGPRTLLLANAWDVATARLVERLGLPAVATTSHAIADALGHPDDDSMPVGDVFAAVARIVAAVSVPVTADLEAGYGLPADELVERLLDAGAVGLNLEDSDHHGTGVLVDVDRQAARLADVKAAAAANGVDVVLNARIDVFLRRAEGGTDEALRRASAYRDAGADCVYPIGLADEDSIRAFVDDGHVVNVLTRPHAPPPARLAELGVRRISFGSTLMRRALGAVEEAVERAREGLGPAGAAG